jgi:hypothetical protein
VSAAGKQGGYFVRELPMKAAGPIFAFVLTLWSLAAAMSAQAETRTALVIGNSKYASAPLANPIRDATAVAAALKEAGFEVILRADADKATLAGAVEEFRETLAARQGVALFYFAGHGVQIGGENYLIPIDARLRSEADIKTGALRAAEVTEAMSHARTSLNIVVLDACRDNGFGASQVRGLSRMDTGSRLFVSFSTSPGSVALDGTGGNSPYTKYLAEAIKTPDIPLEEAFKRTLKGVYQETSGQQTPWISSSYFGDFFFRWTGAKPSAQASGQQTALNFPPLTSPSRGENAIPSLSGIYRADGTNPNGGTYSGMVAITQNADQFTFKWWIGRQTLLGTGQFAGRMLVVNWGDKNPVIYNFREGGVLDGEWADGKATEKLTLHALTATQPPRPLEGSYHAAGRNPKGATYSGDVLIRRLDPTHYLVDWTIAGSHMKGEGLFDGNLLTVNWGAETPVVYAQMQDGSLQGLWDAGTGEETLTPK